MPMQRTSRTVSLVLLILLTLIFLFFFFNDTATTEIYTLSLHDALPICLRRAPRFQGFQRLAPVARDLHADARRSEEHTSELQSPCNLVCRLLLEKKKNTAQPPRPHEPDAVHAVVTASRLQTAASPPRHGGQYQV